MPDRPGSAGDMLQYLADWRMLLIGCIHFTNVSAAPLPEVQCAGCGVGPCGCAGRKRGNGGSSCAELGISTGEKNA